MGFSIATFNARDLFDDEPPSVIAELDRVAFGEAEQALARRLYRRKLEAIAAVVRRVDADVVAFQEVKNTRVLDDVRALLPPRDGAPAGGYGPARVGVADRRGIACGLLSRFPVVATADHVADDLPFPVFVAGDSQPFAGRLRTHRGVLEATIALPDGGALVLFVVHFKSQRPTPLVDAQGVAQPALDHHELAAAEVRSHVARVAEALFVRRLVEQRLDADPRIQLAVAGDFNDHAGSLVVRAVAGSVTSARLVPPDADPAAGAAAQAPKLAGRALFACARAVPPEVRHSLMYRGSVEQLDHVLVSDALWARCQRARFFNETLPEDTASFAEPGGYSLESDHAPLRVDFV